MHGLKEACLGIEGVDRVPAWLEKWASLILEYIEIEHQQLPDALCALGRESETNMTSSEAEQLTKGQI